MPKIVCTKCSMAYVPIELGVKVIETFLNDRLPYKIWNADLFGCPGCGHKIVDGFGNKPLAEHFEADFEKKLASVKQGTHFYIYERR